MTYELAAAADWFGRTVVTEGTLVLGFIIAAIGAVGLAWNKVVRPSYYGIKNARGWIEDVHTVVTRELNNNGGESMKDQLRTVRDLQAKQAAALETVQDDAHDERQKLQQTLDDHIQNAELHHQRHREGDS